MSTVTQSEFETRPPSSSVWLTAAAGLVAVAATAPSLPAVAVGLAGLLVLVVAVSRGARRLQTLGAVVLFAGVLTAGVTGAGPVVMLVATGATVVAWDAGENAISLGQQVGARARTRRAVLVHTGATAAVAVLVGVVGFVIYRAASTGQSTTALVLLLLAAILFAIGFSR